jgi:spore coat protein U-like protein
MKKILMTLAAGTTMIALMPAAHAATANQNFNVTVNLTSVCAITAGPADVAFTYTSFQGSAAVATGGGFSVRCTNTLPYTLSLDATSGTVSGLNYTLALSAASGAGTGAAQSYTVNGGMVANQSGDCAAATCAGSAVRTLTITY